MNLYDQAEEWHRSAEVSCNNGFYQQTVFQCCMSIELFLKSKLAVIGDSLGLADTHNIIGMYNEISSQFNSKQHDVSEIIKLSRKYFNESRYPYINDFSAFNQEFATQFLDNVITIKNWLDNQCIATQEMMLNKFKRQ